MNFRQIFARAPSLQGLGQPFRTLSVLTMVPLLLTGCFGLQPLSLKKETFGRECILTQRGLKYWDIPKDLPGECQITKESLIGCWGKPDKIIKNGCQEDWIYTQTRWVGVSVIACLRIPLVLPVGRGKATLTFTNDVFVSGSDTPLCASLHVFCLIPVPLIKEMKAGEFFYSGPQAGVNFPSYGGGTYCLGRSKF